MASYDSINPIIAKKKTLSGVSYKLNIFIIKKLSPMVRSPI